VSVVIVCRQETEDLKMICTGGICPFTCGCCYHALADHHYCLRLASPRHVTYLPGQAWLVPIGEPAALCLLTCRRLRREGEPCPAQEQCRGTCIGQLLLQEAMEGLRKLGVNPARLSK
jgi:hypothetical protein